MWAPFWAHNVPSQPIRIGQTRLGRSHRESGINLGTTTIGAIWILPGGMFHRTQQVFHTIVRITLSGSSEISSANQIGVGPSPVQISTQSSPLISHMDVTRLSGTKRSLSPYTPDMALTRNPNLFCPFPLLSTNQFSYLYLSLYSI